MNIKYLELCLSFKGIRPILVASYLQDGFSAYLKINNSPLMQGRQNRIFLFWFIMVEVTGHKKEDTANQSFRRLKFLCFFPQEVNSSNLEKE